MPMACVPRTTLQITVVSPCCGKPVEGALICASGKRVGMTSHDGTLRLALPPGNHVITAPDQSCERHTVEIAPEGASVSSIVELRLVITGEIFIYLREVEGGTGTPSHSPSAEEWLFLCTNRFQIPADAKPFVGSQRLGASSYPSSLFRNSPSSPSVRPALGDRGGVEAMLAVHAGEQCGELLGSLELAPLPSSRRKYVANEECARWLQEFQDECVVALLFAGTTPLRIGKLLKASVPALDSVATSPQSTSKISCGSPLSALGSPSWSRDGGPSLLAGF